MKIKNRQHRTLIGLITCAILILSIIKGGIYVSAASKYYIPSVHLYESNAKFSSSSLDLVQSFSYGKNIGSLFVDGDIDHTSTKNGNIALFIVLWIEENS